VLISATMKLWGAADIKNMPKAKKITSSDSIKKKSSKKVIIIGGFSLFIFIFIFLLSYIPSSTLDSQIVTDIKKPTEELCKGEHQLHPPTSWKWPFPASSPDGEYYIDISDAKLGKITKLTLFDSNTQREVGKYFSSYPSLKVYCWAEDSSGIYVADYKPVYGYGGIFTPSPKTGPVKKLLVP